jgi:lipoic acid synthetase
LKPTDDYQHPETARIPFTRVSDENPEALPKPDWMRIRLPVSDAGIREVKNRLRQQGLHSVCEEAACPNLAECFHQGTATFLILGALCTRHCPFCAIAHGRPQAPDQNEPAHLAQTIAHMALRHVVLTSVNRDDLHDGGASHFAACIAAIRASQTGTRIEILTPDFRGCMPQALDILGHQLPDIFNHNLETVPRLYQTVRPGADYQGSLRLLRQFAERHPDIQVKSGLMLGIGETDDEVIEALQDLRAQGVSMLTLGQYLQPSRQHLPIRRYVTPQQFAYFRTRALQMGFTHAACGPLVRSSFHAEAQAQGKEVR